MYYQNRVQTELQQRAGTEPSVGSALHVCSAQHEPLSASTQGSVHSPGAIRGSEPPDEVDSSKPGKQKAYLFSVTLARAFLPGLLIKIKYHASCCKGLAAWLLLQLT